MTTKTNKQSSDRRYLSPFTVPWSKWAVFGAVKGLSRCPVQGRMTLQSTQEISEMRQVTCNMNNVPINDPMTLMYLPVTL